MEVGYLGAKASRPPNETPEQISTTSHPQTPSNRVSTSMNTLGIFNRTASVCCGLSQGAEPDLLAVELPPPKRLSQMKRPRGRRIRGRRVRIPSAIWIHDGFY